MVLVYDLLLEMLDANTSSSSQTASSSPGSDTYSDQYQYPQPPPNLQPGADQPATNHTAVPPDGPAEALILDRHLQVSSLQSPPPSQSVAPAYMATESNE